MTWSNKHCRQDASGLFVWMPVTMTRPDGRPFTLFVYYQRYSGPGWSTGSARGAIELPDGRTKPFQDVIPDLQFRDDNRRLLGGSIRTVLPDGTESSYRIDPVSATGFHLGTGLYGGFEGHYQGEWRGELHTDGEHITDCDTVPVAHRIHQHRDCIVRVEGLQDGSTGVGTMQSNAVGPHRRHGPHRRCFVSLGSGRPRPLGSASRGTRPSVHRSRSNQSGQSAIGADPGHQTIELRRKVFGDVLHGQPIVTDIVDGFDQPAHGVGQVRGCCCDGISLSGHVKPFLNSESR